MANLFQRNDVSGLSCPFIYDFRVDLRIFDALVGEHLADCEDVDAIGGKECRKAVAPLMESDRLCKEKRTCN